MKIHHANCILLNHKNYLRMKKIAAILVISLIASATVFAQRTEVRNATRNLDRGNLSMALTHINNAINDPTTNALPATWTLKARIHMAIAGSTKPEVLALVADPLTAAYEAIKRAEELDAQNLNIIEIQQTFLALSQGFFNAGAIAYNERNFATASRNFEKSFIVSKEFNAIDTATLYNAGVSAELAGDAQRAIDLYTQASELNFNQPFIYSSITNLELQRGNYDEATRWITKGRQKYPDNLDLIFTEANVYLRTGNIPEARRALSLAIEREPLNANLHYAFAVNFDNMYMDTTYTITERLFAFEQAVQSYNRTLELDSTHFEAAYNLGVIHFNEGIRLLVESEKIVRRDMNFAADEKRRAVAMEKWVVAQPYLERALALTGDNKEEIHTVLRSLRELYLRTNQLDKFQKVNTQLNEQFGTQ